MNSQLSMFSKPHHYFVAIDSKKRDFVIYNADVFTLTEEEVLPEDLVPLRYKELTPVIQRLKSEAWSCGCKWFFVIQDEGIYLMNVYDEHFWLCKKHSNKFFQMYLDAPLKPSQ
jgi:hypothetical protein